MLETPDELEDLDALLLRSRASATEHLRDIVREDRALTAREVVHLLVGMKVLSLATVTSRGAPRISAVDGHFLHGSWTFTTSGTSAKSRHLEQRAAASVAHIDHEEFAVFSHGDVVRLIEGDATFDETLAHLTAHYGGSPLSWGDDIRVYRLVPSWMVAFAQDPPRLVERGGLGA